MEPPPTPGLPRIGDYELLEKLGAGGMGTVYVGRHAATGIRRAVKLLAPQATPRAQARFLREGELQARVDDHPNVVRVHTCGRAGDVGYLVLDLLSGGDLAKRLLDGPLPPREAARVALELARGLEHIHAHGILHRDLKPANVLFDERGVARLVDFGLARPEESDLTRTGEIVGTPLYMAPEQVEGRKERIGPRTDVYGLGVVLYQMLTGEVPFDAGDLITLIGQITHGRVTPIRALEPRVPRALARLCARAMAVDPDARPDSAAALAAELQAWLARPTRPVALLAVPAALVLLALGGVLAGSGPTPDAVGARSPTPPPRTPPPEEDPDPEPPPPARPEPQPEPRVRETDLTIRRLTEFVVGPDQLRAQAEAGDAASMHTLAELLRSGAGVPRDLPGATRWYARAGALGYAISWRELGRMHEAGDGVPRDLTEARACYARAAALGDDSAALELGTQLLTGKGGPRDPRAAQRVYEQLAARRNMEGATRLAELLSGEDSGVPQDLDRAVALLRRAVAEDYPEAMDALGKLYRKGLGVPRDPARATALYRQALDLGYEKAWRRLGMQALDGELTPAEAAEAVEHLRALPADEHESKVVLARLLLRSDLPFQDLELARTLLQAASRAGHTEARALLVQLDR